MKRVDVEDRVCSKEDPREVCVPFGTQTLGPGAPSMASKLPLLLLVETDV